MKKSLIAASTVCLMTLSLACNSYGNSVVMPTVTLAVTVTAWTPVVSIVATPIVPTPILATSVSVQDEQFNHYSDVFNQTMKLLSTQFDVVTEAFAKADPNSSDWKIPFGLRLTMLDLEANVLEKTPAAPSQAKLKAQTDEMMQAIHKVVTDGRRFIDGDVSAGHDYVFDWKLVRVELGNVAAEYKLQESGY